MIKKLLFICFFCANIHLLGALPPFAQGKKEIEAILNSPEIDQFIPSGDMILEITKTDFGYLIITNNRSVGVIIHYQAPSKPGPVSFTIEFMQPTQLPVESDTLKDVQ